MRRPREKPESFQLKSVKRKPKKKPESETETEAKVDVRAIVRLYYPQTHTDTE